MLITTDVIMLTLLAFIIFFGLILVGFYLHFLHINYGAAMILIGLFFRIFHFIHPHQILVLGYYLCMMFGILAIGYAVALGHVSSHSKKEKKCNAFRPCPCGSCFYGICQDERSGYIFRQKWMKGCEYFQDKGEQSD